MDFTKDSLLEQLVKAGYAERQGQRAAPSIGRMRCAIL
jgi:hypothetical protein